MVLINFRGNWGGSECKQGGERPGLCTGRQEKNLRPTGYSKVDNLTSWYRSVNFGEKCDLVFVLVDKHLHLEACAVDCLDLRQLYPAPFGMSIDSGLVGSTDFHSSHPQGKGAARAEHVKGTPTQSHIPPSILVYEEKPHAFSGATGGDTFDRLWNREISLTRNSPPSLGPQ